MTTITCPDCGTRYAVADAALAAADAKRRLRCANCGLLWEHVPEPAVPGAEGAPVAAEMATGEAVTEADSAAPVGIVIPLLDPALADPAVAGPAGSGTASSTGPALSESPLPVPASAPGPEPRPSVTAEPPPWRHHRAAIAAAVGLAVLLAGLALVAIIGRDSIEARFPATRSLYAAAARDAVPGSGLKVTVTPMRRADSLVIAGDIINGAENARQVPRLRLTLLDTNKTNLDTKVIEPPVALLSPGAKAHFNTTFEHPASDAVRVDVTFATD